MSARVVVVEDEQIVADDLERKLRRMGHEVVGTAAAGEDAVRISEQLRPDLVLMDIRLQGEVDGVEAARRIQRLTGASIIYVTAYAEVFLTEPERMEPPRICISKPFSTYELDTAIKAALAGSKPAPGHKPAEPGRRV